MNMDSMIHGSYLQASGQASILHIAISTRKQLRSNWTLKKKKKSAHAIHDNFLSVFPPEQLVKPL